MNLVSLAIPAKRLVEGFGQQEQLILSAKVRQMVCVDSIRRVRGFLLVMIINYVTLYMAVWVQAILIQISTGIEEWEKRISTAII